MVSFCYCVLKIVCYLFFYNLSLQGSKRFEEFQNQSLPHKKMPSYMSHDPRYYSHQVSCNDPRQVSQNDPRLVSRGDPRLNNLGQNPRSRDPRIRDTSNATPTMSNFNSGQAYVSSGVPSNPSMHPQIVNSQYQNIGQFPGGPRQPQFATPQPNNAKVNKSQKANNQMMIRKDGNSSNRDYHSHIY